MNTLFFFAAAAVLLWGTAFLYLRSYVRNRTKPDHILGILRDEIIQLEADIDEKTEEDLQLLEDKISALREICGEAEKRIAVYTRELENHSAEERSYASLGRSVPKPKRASKSKKAAKPAGKKSGENSAGLPGLKGLEVLAGAFETATAAYQAEAGHSAAGTIAAPAENAASPAPAATSPAAAAAPANAAIAIAAFASPANAAPAEISDKFVVVNAAAPEAAPAPVITVAARQITPRPPPVRERVAELYRAGFTAELIAKQLDLTVTEAKLHIAMLV
ncbi:MAG: hypothetical protein LBJ31_09840 [Treponema sp.]|jgi:hypothetical protein|nr:hypothetical protein [Treponema sp.]